MQPSLVPYLYCPITKSNLTLHVATLFEEKDFYPSNEIKYGYLESDLGYLYPIIDGVPRLLTNSFLTYEKELATLVPDYLAKKRHLLINYETIVTLFEKNNQATQQSFSAEWGLYDYNADKTWDANRADMKLRFFKEIDEPLDNATLKEKIVLDAGCGNGQLDYLVAAYFKEIIAIDFSNSVVAAYQKCHAKNIHFVQADIQLMPFKPNLFDIVQCSGVLVCIENQLRGFEHLSNMVKPKGKLSVWLYHPRDNFIHNLINSIRGITSKLHWRLQYFIYHYILYPIGFVVKRLKGNKQNRREMLIDIYDWFAPIYRWENKHEEAQQWFNKAFKSSKITSLEVFGFNITGIKR